MMKTAAPQTAEPAGYFHVSHQTAEGVRHYCTFRFPDGVELSGPNALTRHDAFMAATECVAGARPWDDHVELISDAYRSYNAIIDATWLYDSAPNVAEMLRALMAGDAVGARLNGSDYPPELIHKGEIVAGRRGELLSAEAAAALAADMYTTFKRDVEKLARVEGAVKALCLDPHASVARRHPMWRQMLVARSWALMSAGVKAWELDAGDLMDMDAGADKAILNPDLPGSWTAAKVRRLLANSVEGRARRFRFRTFPTKLVGLIDGMLAEAPGARPMTH